MNSQEQAMLYVTEWTNPTDGTTRRPLVDRLFGGWNIDETRHDFGSLCVLRCEVEDWLVATTAQLEIHDIDSDIMRFDVRVDHPANLSEGIDMAHPTGHNRISGNGPTIHHALVHAAHAVADNLEDSSERNAKEQPE